MRLPHEKSATSCLRWTSRHSFGLLPVVLPRHRTLGPEARPTGKQMGHMTNESRRALSDLLQHEEDADVMRRHIEKGYPVSIINRLRNKSGLKQIYVLNACRINEGTFRNRKKGPGRFSPTESDRIHRTATTIAILRPHFRHATDLADWLQTPNRSLRGETPLTYMASQPGTEWLRDHADQLLGQPRTTTPHIEDILDAAELHPLLGQDPATKRKRRAYLDTLTRHLLASSTPTGAQRWFHTPRPELKCHTPLQALLANPAWSASSSSATRLLAIAREAPLFAKEATPAEPDPDSAIA